MPRYAAFLRGMNLGRRRISNDELRRHVAALGFEQVATFRASGNVILDAPQGASATSVARRLEEGLGEALGYAVPVFLRGAEELRAIAAFAPFDARAVAASNGKLQVALLTAKPAVRERRAALAHATDEDRLAIEGRELYWLPSGRMSDSALDLAAVFVPLGASTVRTKGTIDEIAARHFAEGR
jgi:uncharacterized protein (DUF1697 family)